MVAAISRCGWPCPIVSTRLPTSSTFGVAHAGSIPATACCTSDSKPDTPCVWISAASRSSAAADATPGAQRARNDKTARTRRHVGMTGVSRGDSRGSYQEEGRIPSPPLPLVFCYDRHVLESMTLVRVSTRRLAAIALALALAACFPYQVAAQGDPVKWSASTKATKVPPGGNFEVQALAQIAEGWHLYSLTQPPPPIATRITVAPGQPFSLGGSIDAPSPHTAFDQSFGIDTEFYAESAGFSVPVKAAGDAPAGKTKARVQAYFQTCNDQFCLPPKTVTMEVAIEISGAPVAGTPASAPAATPATAAPPAATPSPAARRDADAQAVTPPPAAGLPAAVVAAGGAAHAAS